MNTNLNCLLEPTPVDVSYHSPADHKGGLIEELPLASHNDPTTPPEKPTYSQDSRKRV